MADSFAWLTNHSIDTALRTTAVHSGVVGIFKIMMQCCSCNTTAVQLSFQPCTTASAIHKTKLQERLALSAVTHLTLRPYTQHPDLALGTRVTCRHVWHQAEQSHHRQQMTMLCAIAVMP